MAKAKAKNQFINSFYIRNTVDKDTGVRLKDSLYLVYKNKDTGEKKYKRIDEPKMTIHVLREEYEKDYYQSFVPLDWCEPVKVTYSKREEQMAKMLANMGVDMEHPVDGSLISADEWWKTITAKNSGFYRRTKQVHQTNVFYSSDLDIEDYYRGVFADQYGSDITGLTKGFYDIEVDTVAVGYNGFPNEEEAPAPINAVTYVDDESNVVYTYLLRNDNNPLIQEVEDNLDDFIEELKDSFKDYGDYEYKIKFYTREIDLIKAFFNTVNKIQPDFMGGKLF